MTTSSTTMRPNPTAIPANLLARTGVLVYGIVAYAIGVGSLFWMIATTLDLVPYTGGPLALEPGPAILSNVAFVVAFGVQHAIMARPAFKERWTRIVPPAAERSTFVLAAGLIMGSAMLCWQPLTTEIWSIEPAVPSLAVRTLGVLGWGYMLIASFAIDHFELFGLHQVWNHFRGTGQPKLPVVTRWMYRLDRHPLMTGILIGLWATPTMTLDHLVLAAGLSTYVLIGVVMEERDLLAKHGESYRAYKRSTMTLVPSVMKG